MTDITGTIDREQTATWSEERSLAARAVDTHSHFIYRALRLLSRPYHCVHRCVGPETACRASAYCLRLGRHYDEAKADAADLSNNSRRFCQSTPSAKIDPGRPISQRAVAKPRG